MAKTAGSKKKTPNVVGDSLLSKISSSDPLSEILGIVHVRGDTALSIAPENPQTIAFPASVPCLHVVNRGDIEVRLDGSADWMKLEAGELVFLPHGHGHRVKYGMGIGEERTLDEAITSDADMDLFQLGSGTDVQCFWGSFSFDGDLAGRVLNALPPAIVLRDLKRNPVEWLETACEIILDETQGRSPGAKIMVSRLLDLMLVQILRRWAHESQNAPGWLVGAFDQRVSRALKAIHSNPAHPWRIEHLADLAAMSRSSFVAHFEQVIGQPPGAYLAMWRLDRAAEMIRFSGYTIAEIAAQIGYSSQESFSRAFSKRFGESPTNWRRRGKQTTL